MLPKINHQPVSAGCYRSKKRHTFLWFKVVNVNKAVKVLKRYAMNIMKVIELTVIYRGYCSYRCDQGYEDVCWRYYLLEGTT